MMEKIDQLQDENIALRKTVRDLKEQQNFEKVFIKINYILI